MAGPFLAGADGFGGAATGVGAGVVGADETEDCLESCEDIVLPIGLPGFLLAVEEAAETGVIEAPRGGKTFWPGPGLEPYPDC